MEKYTFVIWTTKTNSYIAPKDVAKLPKNFSNSYEIDAPYAIVDKKIKLPAKVTKIEDISGIIASLVHQFTEDEVKELMDEDEQE